MGTHIFIDETKAKGYVVVAVLCPDTSLSLARRAIGGLVLPGQRSIHMKQEGPRRRQAIADVVTGLVPSGVHAVVLDAGRGPSPERVRRKRALEAIVELAAHGSPASLVIDLDQPLLALPDVVAWCWARGGEWRRRVSPVVSHTLEV
ncbi:hypothetical protein [Nocardioides dubius]|uniref:hypothetical protein n=1 Tax=Nocardioides dubius TaxID=317019 RepID=UPI0031D8A3F6